MPIVVIDNSNEKTLAWATVMWPSKALDKDISTRVSQLSKYFPDSITPNENIHEFFLDLETNEDMLQLLEIVDNPEISSEESAKAGTRALEFELMNNQYYDTVKLLVDQTVSVLIDKEVVIQLVCSYHFIHINFNTLHLIVN